MRASLLKNFNEVWIDNLNGSKHRTGCCLSRYSTACVPRFIVTAPA
jgi:hypothetical protein